MGKKMSKEQFVKKAAADKATKPATKAELVAQAQELIKEGKAQEVAQEVKQEAAPKAEAPKAPAIKVDIIIAKLPDVVRPKNLDELFGFDDGGKTVRRTLRAKFAVGSKHEHKKDWQWKKDDPILAEIVAHFAGRTNKQAVAK